MKLQLHLQEVLSILSLPSRECGLKYTEKNDVWERMESLPSRECGLKYTVLQILLYSYNVTPFAGVWIEIEVAR